MRLIRPMILVSAMVPTAKRTETMSAKNSKQVVTYRGRHEQHRTVDLCANCVDLDADTLLDIGLPIPGWIEHGGRPGYCDACDARLEEVRS